MAHAILAVNSVVYVSTLARSQAGCGGIMLSDLLIWLVISVCGMAFLVIIWALCKSASFEQRICKQEEWEYYETDSTGNQKGE